jgi:hypothetical protein
MLKGLYVIRQGDNLTWPLPARGRPKYVLFTTERPDFSLAIGPLEQIDRCVKAWRTDDDLRKAWRDAGGRFTGPIVKTASMPETKLFEFLRKQGF